MAEWIVSYGLSSYGRTCKRYLKVSDLQIRLLKTVPYVNINVEITKQIVSIFEVLNT